MTEQMLYDLRDKLNSYEALREALELAETLISKDIVRDAGCLVKIKAALALADKETP